MSVEKVSPGIIKVELSSDPEVCKAKLHESLDFYWEREDPVKALKVVSGVAFATALRLQDGDANVSIFIEAKKQDQTIVVEKYGDPKYKPPGKEEKPLEPDTATRPKVNREPDPFDRAWFVVFMVWAILTLLIVVSSL